MALLIFADRVRRRGLAVWEGSLVLDSSDSSPVPCHKVLHKLFLVRLQLGPKASIAALQIEDPFRFVT